MKILTRTVSRPLMACMIGGALLALGACGGEHSVVAAELNPAAAKTINPCAAKTINPCAAKTLNPCAAKTLNPCAAKGTGAAHASNPCGAKNPCNPCGGARVDPAKVTQGRRVLSRDADLALGEKLWNDRGLASNGLACSTCHINKYMQMQPGFAKPYPHRVAMPHQQAGLDKVNAAEMVQFCMLAPMAAEPLDWDSRELASLAAYVESIRPGYKPVAGGGANPCNPCNPCAMKNPCNPCNPCSRKR